MYVYPLYFLSPYPRSRSGLHTLTLLLKTLTEDKALYYQENILKVVRTPPKKSEQDLRFLMISL